MHTLVCARSLQPVPTSLLVMTTRRCFRRSAPASWPSSCAACGSAAAASPATRSPRRRHVDHEGRLRPLDDDRREAAGRARAATAAVPDPPTYTKCVAALRKQPSRPRASRSRPTRRSRPSARSSTTGCKTQVIRSCARADPERVDQQEAKAQGVKVTDAATSRSSSTTRRSSRFPSEADLPEVPQELGHDARRTCSTA